MSDRRRYCGRLLMDYFNYSIPGLHTLSLHGCSLRDHQLNNLLSGLRVNTSLTNLTLSCNILTVTGFSDLFAAVQSNKKHKIILKIKALAFKEAYNTLNFQSLK